MCHRSFKPIITLLILPLLLPLIGCASGFQLGQVGVEVQYDNPLVLAGLVENPDQSQWLNGYVVILFKDDQELRRVETQLNEFKPSGVGSQDGFFKFELPNEYDLSPNHTLFKNGIELNLDTTAAEGQAIGLVYHWYGALRPGDMIRLEVPQKRISYTLKVMPMPAAELPADLQAAGSAQLHGSNVVAKAAQTGQATAVPPTSATNATNGQGGGAPPTSAGAGTAAAGTTAVSWNRTLTNFEGNRWEVWETFVLPHNPGLTWNQFEQDVLLHNPQLVQDQYVFRAHKTYLIP